MTEAWRPRSPPERSARIPSTGSYESLALGPHPQRAPTLLLALGFSVLGLAWPQAPLPYLPVPPCLVSTFTRSPSTMLRTELYGPVITWSPPFKPERTSKCLSPAIPVLIGTSSTRVL